MATYLVTGGAGFIGSNIVKRLLKEKAKVRVLDNFLTGKRENLKAFKGEIELFERDLRCIDEIRPAFKGVDYVLHQAALPSVDRSIKNPLLSNDINIIGTLNVLICARDAGVKRIVYASSSSVYGDTPVLPKREDMPLSPLSPYAITKLGGEYYCRIFQNIYNLETVCLRYFNVFGPHQDPDSEYAAVIPRFISSVIKGVRPTIFGDGEQSRDFTFVDNVVEANLLACKARKAPGKIMNIACGQRKTVLQLLNTIVKVLGADIKPIFDKPRKGDVKHSLADINLAKDTIGYKPMVGFEEGLKSTIDWFSNFYE